MSKVNPNDSAFPLPVSAERDPHDRQLSGMTIREYFAGMAMAGMLASGKYTSGESATYGVAAADALLSELNKTESK